MPGDFCHESQRIHTIVIKSLSAENRSIPSCEPTTGKYVKLGCICIEWNFILWTENRLMDLGTDFLHWFSDIPYFLSDNSDEGCGCTNNNQKKIYPLSQSHNWVRN